MSEKTMVNDEKKRLISNKRADELRERINDYLEARDNIPTGFSDASNIHKSKEKILKLFGASEEEWQDWKWQMRNRISSIEKLAEIIDLSKEDVELISKVGAQFRWAASPYYVSLMSATDANCPIRVQTIPCDLELEDNIGKDDPMGEEFTSPVPYVTRRYPDRLIIKVTNQCAMYCRHCQRRRNIGEVDKNTPKEYLQDALDYIRNNPEIRDVLITGGDALMLSNSQLDWLLTELDNIPHVEIKRLGTRTLVTMPQRVTPELCAVLEKHGPLYLNTQFNHPLEITPEVKKATKMLSRAGVVMGNQAVLLKGINNDPHIMKKLNHELLKVMIRPYYIFHAKAVTGTSHFITRIEDGIEIMEQLRGYTSGLAIPTYIVNAPLGQGKTPMLPEYLVSSGQNFVNIRTWENKVVKYPNHCMEN